MRYHIEVLSDISLAAVGHLTPSLPCNCGSGRVIITQQRTKNSMFSDSCGGQCTGSGYQYFTLSSKGITTGWAAIL